MAPILLFLLGVLVSAQRDDSVRLYPGLARQEPYSNEVTSTQIYEDSSTENPVLYDSTTENDIEHNGDFTEKPEQEAYPAEDSSDSTDIPSTDMPNSDVTSLPEERDTKDNEIENTYYEVDEKQSKQVETKVVQERHGSHPCVRECLEGAPPMRCYYHFEVEWYHTMSKACYNCPYNKTDCDREHCVAADGIKRPIITVNRQLPGPTVEVCLGDTIIADVVNHMMEETTSIHWHGQHQKEAPYMDGVPYVTQCPILPKSTFRYTFKADTSGTHFWHSHTGCQRADGLFGALIVHKLRSSDPHIGLYDFDLTEHIIQLLDWGHKLGIDKFLAHHHSNGDNKPVSLLVNGRGWVGGHREIPPAKFIVEQGYSYRFKVINAGFLNCPIEISVDNHTIIVISSDGRDVRPVRASSLVTYAGERFDFILNADQNKSNYWIRVRGLMDCDERFTSTHQVAVLQYKGAPVDEEPEGTVDYESSRRHGMQVNSLNVGPGTELSTVISELHSAEEDDRCLQSKPDMQFYISYDFYAKDNPHYHRSELYSFYDVPDVNQRLYTPQLNHISMKMKPFPLLPARHLVQPDMFCNQSTVSNCENSYCECTHVLQVPLHSCVEMMLIDKGHTYDANHPFHLHGHLFHVVAMDRVGNYTTVEEIKKLDEQGLIKRKLKGAPLKDTVTVPDGGYTVVRFYADNPGYWLFHCHIEFHVELGMAIIFKVGEHSDMLPVPHGFPQCGDYMPDVETEEAADKENEVPFQRLIQTPSSSGKQAAVSVLLSLMLLSCFFL